MLKDTKSLGNNKAPACESRGFVHKKRGVHFDTPPLSLISGLFVGIPGFEPGKTGPESVVLPLHHIPLFLSKRLF